MRLGLCLVMVFMVAAALGGPAAADGQPVMVVRLGGPMQPAVGEAATFGGTATDLPSWLRWALSPQLQSGSAVGSIGMADRSYRGATWTLPLASSLLQQNDRLTLGFSLGNGFGDAFASDGGRDARTQGPTPTTRLGAAIGYQVTQRIGLYLLFDHTTVSGIAREDEISNELGMRLGFRF